MISRLFLVLKRRSLLQYRVSLAAVQFVCAIESTSHTDSPDSPDSRR